MGAPNQNHKQDLEALLPDLWYEYDNFVKVCVSAYGSPSFEQFWLLVAVAFH